MSLKIVILIGFLCGVPSWATSNSTDILHATGTKSESYKNGKDSPGTIRAVELAKTNAPENYLTALENEGISNEQALADLVQAWKESEDPAEREKLVVLIKTLQEKLEEKPDSQTPETEKDKPETPAKTPGSSSVKAQVEAGLKKIGAPQHPPASQATTLERMKYWAERGAAIEMARSQLSGHRDRALNHEGLFQKPATSPEEQYLEEARKEALQNYKRLETEFTKATTEDPTGEEAQKAGFIIRNEEGNPIREPKPDASFEERAQYAKALQRTIRQLGGEAVDPRGYVESDTEAGFKTITAEGRSPALRENDLVAAVNESFNPTSGFSGPLGLLGKEARAALLEGLSDKAAAYESKLVEELVRKGTGEELKKFTSGLSPFGKVEVTQGLAREFVSATPESAPYARTRFEEAVKAVYPSSLQPTVLSVADNERKAHLESNTLNQSRSGRGKYQPEVLGDAGRDLTVALRLMDPRHIARLKEEEDFSKRNQKQAEAFLASNPEVREAWSSSTTLLRESIRSQLSEDQRKVFDVMRAAPLLSPDGSLGVRFVPNSEQEQQIAQHYLRSSLEVTSLSNMETDRLEFRRRDISYPMDWERQIGILSGQIPEGGIRRAYSSGLDSSVSPLDAVAVLAGGGLGIVGNLIRLSAIGAVGGAGFGLVREGAIYADASFSGLWGAKKKYDAEGATERVAQMATFGAFLVPAFTNAPKAVQTGLAGAGLVLGAKSAADEARESNYITAGHDLFFSIVGVAAMKGGSPSRGPAVATSPVTSTLHSTKNTPRGNGILAMLTATDTEAANARRYLLRAIENGDIKEIPSGVLQKVALRSPDFASELGSLTPKSASNRSVWGRAYDWLFPPAKELPQKHLEGPVAPELPRFQQLPDPQKDPIGYLAALQDDPQALARFFSSAEGGTLYFSDYHGGSHTAGTIEALSSFRGKLKDIVIGGDLLDARANRGKTPAELAREIITILDRIHEATGVPKRDIKVPLGNHDGPTIKVHREGMTNADRVISQEVGEEMGTLIREAGYTMITTSPEQSAFVAPDVVFSHVPNQTGPRRAAMETYARDDLPSGINDPTLPTSARVLPPGVRYQIHGDAHHGNAIFGVNYHDNGLFVNVGLPAAGGVLANNSFPGVVVLSAPHRGGIRVPVALEFTPGAGGATGTYAPRGLPTRFTRELPPGLDEAPGIVPRLPLPPIERAPQSPVSGAQGRTVNIGMGSFEGSGGASFGPGQAVPDLPQSIQLPSGVWVESRGAVFSAGASRIGAGTQTITGAFDAPYQRALEAIQERRSAGTLRKNGGMVEVLYPGGASEPVVGISKNLRPNREPGPTDIYSQEALTKISEALKKGDHRWHPPGQCGLCDAIRSAGRRAIDPSTRAATPTSSVAFPMRDGRLYPQVRPQCKSCQTLGVRDLFDTTTQIDVNR